MKCPKCGYHSFDSLTKCKKCNSDLTTFKSKYQLRSLILPHRLNPAKAQPEPEAPRFSQPPPTTPAGSATPAAVDFGFDFMDEAPPTQTQKPEPVRPASEPPAPPTMVAVQPDTFTEKDAGLLDSFSTEEELFEEAEADDTFGLDFAWDTDLPVLDEGLFVEEEPEMAEPDPRSDWNVKDKALNQGTLSDQRNVRENPRHPFESRGSDVAHPAPVASPASAAAMTPASAELSPEPAGEGPAPALPRLPSFRTRCLALSVDLLVLLAATLLFLAAGEIALAPEGARRLLPAVVTLRSLAIPYFLVLFSVCFGYFTLFHFFAGQTPGKMLLRLRVETEAGQPLLFSQAFLRSVGGLFSLLPLGFGFLALLFDPLRRGWNDRLAGTLVVTAPSRDGS